MKNDSVYIPKEDVNQLEKFAKLFGAEPWIAVRFHQTQWHFISMDNLELTERCAVITTKNIKTKGLLFEECIGNF